MKAIPTVKEPKSLESDQKWDFYFYPNLDFLRGPSRFRAYRLLIRFFKEKRDMNISVIAEKTGIDKKEIKGMIGMLSDRNMITQSQSEEQIKLSF